MQRAVLVVAANSGYQAWIDLVVTRRVGEKFCCRYLGKTSGCEALVHFGQFPWRKAKGLSVPLIKKQLGQRSNSYRRLWSSGLGDGHKDVMQRRLDHFEMLDVAGRHKRLKNLAAVCVFG